MTALVGHAASIATGVAAAAFVPAGNEPHAFGVPSTTWTAVAAMAQALAALGAIALMVTTLLARRDAKEATTQSRKLAVETERLVSATTAAQALAVRPVLECRRPGESRRLSIRNCGHGPVVDPQALTPAGGLTRLQAREGRERNALAEEYVEVGSLGVGEEAFVALGPKAPDAVVITIQGASLAGQHLSWTLDEREFESRAVVVATEIGEVAA